MAAETKPLPTGMKAPGFNLIDEISGKEYFLEHLKGEKATVIMFICNHCPYVKHVIKEIVEVANDYRHKGVAFVAINSNDAVKYPEDSPEKMKAFAAEHAFTFPYLYDETQETAKNYDAACTPEFYVFDDDLRLQYHGQIDDSRPKNNIPVTGKDLRNAINKIISGEEITGVQRQSIGCSIKWK